MKPEQYPWLIRTNQPLPPTFLCVGAMKCGTTSLHEYLDRHPEVSVPAGKEVNFFSRWLSDITIDEYEAMFEPKKVRGECCPQYIDSSAHIKQIYPEAHIFLLVRNPVERLESQIRHDMMRGEYNDSVHEILERGYFDFLPNKKLLTSGQYHFHANLFKKRGFKTTILNFHEMADDPVKFYRNLCNILEIRYLDIEPPIMNVSDTTFRLSNKARKNVTKYYLRHNEMLKQDFGVRL